MAQANPDINYIGIEMFRDIIVTAVQKAEVADKPGNLRLLNVDAGRMAEFFAPGEVSRVYLNFSDPWPKTRHAKRRLTHDNFLRLYESVMPAGGEVHFKTDNRGLFEYSLMNMTDYGMRLADVSLDLHADNPEDNIMTEYEEKFSSMGQPIYRLEAAFRNAPDEGE
ncbi:tRNA (guanine-N7-)-methyltransferase [Bhargavaea ullalensis]|uniref:tRNA (guanine(46)-N(7))-methyltransferase n=2 Tax=Bhargavaea ullalensis TaxID=1265685 RepID=A0ABV2GAP0_9BACL